MNSFGEFFDDGSLDCDSITRQDEAPTELSTFNDTPGVVLTAVNAPAADLPFNPPRVALLHEDQSIKVVTDTVMAVTAVEGEAAQGEVQPAAAVVEQAPVLPDVVVMAAAAAPSPSPVPAAPADGHEEKKKKTKPGEKKAACQQIVAGTCTLSAAELARRGCAGYKAKQAAEYLKQLETRNAHRREKAAKESDDSAEFLSSSLATVSAPPHHPLVGRKGLPQSVIPQQRKSDSDSDSDSSSSSSDSDSDSDSESVRRAYYVVEKAKRKLKRAYRELDKVSESLNPKKKKRSS